MRLASCAGRSWNDAWGGGTHFINKRIANVRRIPLLATAFPNARFVDITRDGRAVAVSLSRVDWWEYSVVWWYGGTPKAWREDGRDPWELCARNWVEEVRAIDSGIGELNPEQVLRLTYEEFTAEPVRTIERVAAFAGLTTIPAWRRDIERIEFRNRNDSWKKGTAAGGGHDHRGSAGRRAEQAWLRLTPGTRSRFVFVLGTGRCGSTLVEEVLCRHPSVGFVSNLEDRFNLPLTAGRWNGSLYRRLPAAVTQKSRVRYAPSEAYRMLSREVRRCWRRRCATSCGRCHAMAGALDFDAFFIERASAQGTRDIPPQVHRVAARRIHPRGLPVGAVHPRRPRRSGGRELVAADALVARLRGSRSLAVGSVA